jgi:disulfide bond formation protein DsbB
MNNCCICWFSRIFLLGILIFKGLTARRLYKSFGVKGLKVVIHHILGALGSTFLVFNYAVHFLQLFTCSLSSCKFFSHCIYLYMGFKGE